MKAERRHELQTNSLALWLQWRAPELWAKYGSRILLGLIILVLLVLFVRHRIQAPRLAAARANMALAQAEQQVEALRQLAATPGTVTDVPRLVQSAIQESDQPHVQGRAYLLLGDYYWAQYSFPELPGAATQPSLQPAGAPAQLLDQAASAYQRALTVQNVPPHQAAAARIGLGVIAETRAFKEDQQGGPEQAGKSPHWSAAREQYEAIAKNEVFPPMLRQEANWHLENLPRLQRPVWLVEAPPATQPAPAEPLGPLGPDLPAAPAPAPTTPTPPPAQQ